MGIILRTLIYIALLTIVAACTSNKALMSENTKIKVAAFNVSMDATNYVGRDALLATNQVLIERLKNNHPQIKNIAEIIQRTRPDIILLNEFDYIADPSKGVEVFINDYLMQAQHPDLAAIDYPYYYYAPVNTGKPSPYDLNGDGKKTGTQSDAWGFGFFEGHYGMMILSRYPIDSQNVRTFQHFKWKDMPNAMRPKAPNASEYFYSDEVWEKYPLSSKSHWDVPVNVNGTILHLLASHPTPPVFDGEEDRNGTKNHDEVRFWLDYITPGNSTYIYDDKGKKGGLPAQSRFVILGDQNASNTEGDARQEAIKALLSSPQVNDTIIPQSKGGDTNDPENELSKFHTASWGMRVDYVLPSSYGVKVVENGVFWPTEDTDTYRLVKDRESSSDHRLVWSVLSLDYTL